MLVKKEDSLVNAVGSQRTSLVNEVNLVRSLVLGVGGAGYSVVFATDRKLIGLKGGIGITHKKNKA